MTRSPVLLATAFALSCAAAAPLAAEAHRAQPGDTAAAYPYGETARPSYSLAMRNLPDPGFASGRCTQAARDAMPAGAAHDHAESTQHAFACGVKPVFYDDLREVLGGRQDSVITEMDVKGDLAVITVSYPESGFLLYDVSEAGEPEFLSWYRSAQCEGEIYDIDCGGFVDLAPDGKTVYLSKQASSFVPRLPPDESSLAGLPADYQGLEVIDIADPRKPVLRQIVPVPSAGGVHTARSFDVPIGGSPTGAGPREPGRYVVASVLLSGAMLFREAANGQLVPIGLIRVDDLHDTFVQQDELTGRTFLYIAMGLDSGFMVYDITAPTRPVALAEWDITPQCAADWYAHTIDVTTYKGRRIVTLPVETLDFAGSQSAEDQAEGCGKVAFNGDMAGPLFIVDATDLTKLAPPTPIDDEATETAGGEVQRRSEAALITSWANAAGRAGGTFVFSPHNQQIDGTRIFLSQYHGGAVVLDAREAFEGRNVRPKEIAVASPGDARVRPQTPPAALDPTSQALFTPYMSRISDLRPWAWDMSYVDGHVLIPDGSGGLSSFELLGAGAH